MLKVENVETYGWEAAIRGMRNPMNSWEKSDSHLVKCADACMELMCEYASKCEGYAPDRMIYVVGENDLKLMQNLAKSGTDHSKFLRMITVTADITAPRYWWTEFDTYKVGTVRNSCSTMHKIHAKEFDIDDFSCENMNYVARDNLADVIKCLNVNRQLYRDTGDKLAWYSMIQTLPQSYNQRATVQMNYQVLRMIRNSERRTHKLDEWRIDFMDFIDSLPYAKELLIF